MAPPRMAAAAVVGLAASIVALLAVLRRRRRAASTAGFRELGPSSIQLADCAASSDGGLSADRQAAADDDAREPGHAPSATWPAER
jgi:hypothetical protein